MSDASNRKSVLFVCLGNICRSPTGEGVMQCLVQQRGLGEQVHVDSAGTAGFHIGHEADARMQAAANRRGIPLHSRARQVLPEDLDLFDLVIPMDRENLQDINRLTSESPTNVRLLSSFLGDEWPNDVPDPYYGGPEGFEYVLDMIQAACPIILDELIRQ